MEAVGNSTPGLDINKLFNSGLDKIGQKGQDLNKQMDKIMAGKEVSPEQMLALQFQMGQYNAMMETLSSVTKSTTDMMKSLAQRTS